MFIKLVLFQSHFQLAQDAPGNSVKIKDRMNTNSHQFSEREKEVAQLLLQGKSNKQIAFALGISESTVEYHLKNIYKKLDVNSRTEAVLALQKPEVDQAKNHEPVLTLQTSKKRMFFLGGSVILIAIIASTLFLIKTFNTSVPPFPIPSVVDSDNCIGYDPNNLTVKPIENAGWELIYDSQRLALLSNIHDTKQTLELAKQFNQMCVIGEKTTQFRTQYWIGGSGETGNLTNNDCLSYDPKKIEMVSDGNLWRLMDMSEGQPSYMLTFSERADAEAAMQIIKTSTQHCFIGRDNNRENRFDYIVEYWK